MKYKVGDKVRVRKDLDEGKRYSMADGNEHNWVVGEMLGLRGKVTTIERLSSGQYVVAGSSCLWVDEMFEGLAEQPKIVITTDGETTLARLYEGKRVVKIAGAQCSPLDAFDFRTGAKLALERLAVEPEPKPAVPTFAAGDIVRVVRKSSVIRHHYKIGDVAKVRSVSVWSRRTVLHLVSNGLPQAVDTEDVEKINF